MHLVVRLALLYDVLVYLLSMSVHTEVMKSSSHVVLDLYGFIMLTIH